MRFRYKLEGFDRTWLDPVGVMRFAVRFQDAADNTISGEEFDAHGESRGWSGSLAGSDWLQRREELEVPKGAAKLQMWLSSAGPQQTMGVYGIGDLVVRLQSEDSTAGERSVVLISKEGSLLGTVSGTPRGWARHGTSLGIAQVLPQQNGSPRVVMRDDRPDAFGGWLTVGAGLVSLEGVSRIVLEWREAYSIGWGGAARVTYQYLPPGDYQMRIQPVNIEGAGAGEEVAWRLAVVPPFYETRWFWGLAWSAVAGGVALVVRRVTRKRMQQRLDVLERERAIERERSRIARDLHDNLGADLTHLALLSDLARVDAADALRSAGHFDQIFDMARSLTRKVDEIVWAVNPAHDSLRGFVPFLCSHTQNYLQAACISCRLGLPDQLPEVPLSSVQRHHLFLVIKEALHNVVKHAGASEVWLRLEVASRQLRLEVADNGRGSVLTDPAGDGTLNMRRRMAELGGTVVWEGEVGGGTRVRITLPLAFEADLSANR